MDIPPLPGLEEPDIQRPEGAVPPLPGLDSPEWRREEHQRRMEAARERSFQTQAPTDIFYQMGRHFPFVGPAMDYVQGRAYNAAQERMQAGRPRMEDYQTIADRERAIEQQQEGGLAGEVTGALARVPGMALESIPAGAVAGRAAGAAGEYLSAVGTRLPPSFLGATTEAGTTAGLGRLGRFGNFVGEQVVATPLMPSLYAEDWAQRGGRIQDLPPALGLGVLQNLVLGATSQVGGGIQNWAARLGARTGVGVLSQQAADLGAYALKLKSGYGTLEDLLNERTEQGLRSAAINAITFAAFNLAHGNAGRPSMEAFNTWMDRMAKAGLSREAASRNAQDAMAAVNEAVGHGFTADQVIENVARLPNPYARGMAQDMVESLPEVAWQGETTINRPGGPYADTPRMRQFVERADKIREALPPVQEGFERLWRGNRPGEEGSTRFTDSLEGIALPFNDAYGGQLSYVDVPSAELRGYKNELSPNEYNLPQDLAGRAQPATNVAPTVEHIPHAGPQPGVDVPVEAPAAPPTPPAAPQAPEPVQEPQRRPDRPISEWTTEEIRARLAELEAKKPLGKKSELTPEEDREWFRLADEHDERQRQALVGGPDDVEEPTQEPPRPPEPVQRPITPKEEPGRPIIQPRPHEPLELAQIFKKAGLTPQQEHVLFERMDGTSLREMEANADNRHDVLQYPSGKMPSYETIRLWEKKAKEKLKNNPEALADIQKRADEADALRKQREEEAGPPGIRREVQAAQVAELRPVEEGGPKGRKEAMGPVGRQTKTYLAWREALADPTPHTAERLSRELEMFGKAAKKKGRDAMAMLREVMPDMIEHVGEAEVRELLDIARDLPNEAERSARLLDISATSLRRIADPLLQKEVANAANLAPGQAAQGPAQANAPSGTAAAGGGPAGGNVVEMKPVKQGNTWAVDTGQGIVGTYKTKKAATDAARLMEQWREEAASKREQMGLPRDMSGQAQGGPAGGNVVRPQGWENWTQLQRNHYDRASSPWYKENVRLRNNGERTLADEIITSGRGVDPGSVPENLDHWKSVFGESFFKSKGKNRISLEDLAKEYARRFPEEFRDLSDNMDDRKTRVLEMLEKHYMEDAGRQIETILSSEEYDHAKEEFGRDYFARHPEATDAEIEQAFQEHIKQAGEAASGEKSPVEIIAGEGEQGPAPTEATSGPAAPDAAAGLDFPFGANAPEPVPGAARATGEPGAGPAATGSAPGLRGGPGSPVTEQERIASGVGGGQEDATGARRLRELALANAVTDRERESRGEEPIMRTARQADPVVWDRAMERLAGDPEAGSRLVEELLQKPRATTDEENALLLHRRIYLDNEYERAIRQENALFNEGVRRRFDPSFDKAASDVAIHEAEARRVNLKHLNDDADRAITLAGSEWGRSGRWRRVLARSDFSLTRMLLEAESAKKAPLSNEERLEITDLQAKIKELQDKLDKAADPRSSWHADTRIDLAKNKAAFRKMTDDFRYSQMSTPQKVFRSIRDIYDSSRALITSIDLSAVLRQGGMFTFAHPIKAAGIFADSIRAMASERYAAKIMDQIDNRPNAYLYERAKLYLAREGKLTGQEEAYIGRWIEKIPGVAASQRAYTTFLNKARADLFDSMTASLGRRGAVTDAEASAIARYINISTGRGELGPLEKAAVPLAEMFFSPRFTASRFQLLAGAPLYGGTGRTRLAIAGEYARALAGIGLFYAVSKMAGKDDVQIQTDLRSSDFGKVRIHNTRIDPLMGLSQVAVFGARLVSGETRSTITERVSPLRGPNVPYGGQTVSDVVWRFLRSKLAPVPGAVMDAVSGKNVVGEGQTPATIAQNLIEPIAIRDVWDAMTKDDGMPRGVAASLLAILGMGTQVYERRPR